MYPNNEPVFIQPELPFPDGCERCWRRTYAEDPKAVRRATTDLLALGDYFSLRKINSKDTLKQSKRVDKQLSLFTQLDPLMNGFKRKISPDSQRKRIEI